MKFSLVFLFLFALFFHSQAQPKREIRAVWLTTNYGLDWPSKPAKNAADIERLKEELNAILSQLKEANINMVFLQTRLRGNVIYPSRIEPYSQYIISGNYPLPEFDILAYAIEACHQNGIECHAWFVTYPLGTPKNSVLPPGIKDKKYLVKTFQNELYLDPGHPETNTYLLSLITELVSNYDLDGLHFDYVRYPDRGARFPDDPIYKIYGGKLPKADWRRANINRFVYAAYDTVKALKPWVQVSSSVIGMYKNAGSSRSHWTAYHDVYQDPIDWIEKGKHDFLVPMMYYEGDLFFPFVPDWVARNKDRFIVPGLGIYQLDEKDWPRETILEQLRYSREKQADGNAFYRLKHLTDNKKDIFDEIKKWYASPAVLPPLSWLSETIPDSPLSFEIQSKEDQICFQWEEPGSIVETKLFYNLYRSSEFPVDTENPENLIATRLAEPCFKIPLDNSIESGYYYVITSYDRFHNESISSFPVYFVTGNFEK